MSIENQLKLAFKQSAEHLKQPHQLDARIEHLFEKQSQVKGKSSKWFSKQNKFARIMFIAACFIIFSGIASASTLLYHLKLNYIKIEVSKDSQFNFTPKQMDEIIRSRKEVMNQLVPGESAFMFIAEIDKIKLPQIVDEREGFGLIKMSKPYSYTDINQWKDVTKNNIGEFKTPNVLPAGFTFTRGEIEQTTNATDDYDYSKYYKMLKDKAMATNGKMAWQKADEEDISRHNSVFKSYGLIYTNRKNNQIEVSYSLMPPGYGSNDSVTYMPMGESSTADNIRVGGIEGIYTLNKTYILNETGYMQDINWLEQVNGQTIMYDVSTPSKNITKDDLLLVANNLK